MYVAGYTFCVLIERIRSIRPPAVGWRVNEVVSLVVFAIAVTYLVLSMRRPRRPEVVAGGEVAGAATSALASSPVSDRISPADVAHVAQLARLELTVEELQLYTDQLGVMLDHFRDIDALDLADVAPMKPAAPLQNVLREGRRGRHPRP